MQTLTYRLSLRAATVARKGLLARSCIRSFSCIPKKLSSVETVKPDLTLPGQVPESGQTRANKSSEKLFSLKDRTVLVTGGARGLGITLAQAVLETGGDLVCLDILPEPSSQEWTAVTKLCKDNGLNATYLQCDATKEQEVQEVIAKAGSAARKNGKPVRGLVHCAGIQQMVDAIDYPVDGFRQIFDVNVTGSFIVAKHTAQLMRDAGEGGSIILIASMSGQIANRGIHCAAYNSSKAAVHQLCRSLSVEWGRYGIRVNTLSPGYIRTTMLDKLIEVKPEMEKLFMAGALLGRLGAPEDFKAPVVYMLGDGASFMTGSDLRVDGGHCASA